MIYDLYCVKDNLVSFWPPQCEQNEQTALRNFRRMLSEGSGMPNFAPADFDLYKVGSFDSEKGVVEKLPFLQLVATGSNEVMK